MAIVFGIILASIVLLFLCAKAVSGWFSPRSYETYLTGEGKSDTIQLPGDETVSWEEWQAHGSKKDWEIDQMVERQNQCLEKNRQLECE